MTTARGLRNNNPGNIRSSSIHWQGQIGVDDAGFCIFDTADNGLRAECLLLISYQEKHGLDTVRGIINRWAPPSENVTTAYVTAVAQEMGVADGDPLNLHDPRILVRLCKAIVRHENGVQPYSAAMISDAAMVALGLSTETVEAAPPQGPVLVPPTPEPAPQPKPKRTEELTDIPAAELDKIVAQYKAEGATVSISTQPNGMWRVLATFGGK